MTNCLSELVFIAWKIFIFIQRIIIEILLKLDIFTKTFMDIEKKKEEEMSIEKDSGDKKEEQDEKNKEEEGIIIDDEDDDFEEFEQDGKDFFIKYEHLF